MTDAEPIPAPPPADEAGAAEDNPGIRDRSVREVVERTRDVIRKTRELLENSRELLDKVRHRDDEPDAGAGGGTDGAGGEAAPPHDRPGGG